MPLGNPADQSTISVTTTAAETEITVAMSAIEFINMGTQDVYYGKLSTLTSDRGAPISSNGRRRTFENIPAGWKISFLTASGTSTLRVIHYK